MAHRLSFTRFLTCKDLTDQDGIKAIIMKLLSIIVLVIVIGD